MTPADEATFIALWQQGLETVFVLDPPRAHKEAYRAETSPTHPGHIRGITPTHSRQDGLTQRVAIAAEAPASQPDGAVA
jgi:hypothetical protein